MKETIIRLNIEESLDFEQRGKLWYLLKDELKKITSKEFETKCDDFELKEITVGGGVLTGVVYVVRYFERDASILCDYPCPVYHLIDHKILESRVEDLRPVLGKDL